MKTAAEILGMTDPGELFSSADSIDYEYRDLIKKWHPDKNHGSAEATSVTAKVNELYSKGLAAVAFGKWTGPNYVRFRTTDGKFRTIKFLAVKNLEIGTMYVSNTVLVFLVNHTNKDLCDNAKKMMLGLKTPPDEKIKKALGACLPKLADSFELDDGSIGVVINKTPDVLLLRDVLNYHTNNPIPDWNKHVAWIISRLYALVSYFNYSEVAHNAITLDTCFISPEFHTCSLLGGWWYSVHRGTKISAVPTDVYNIMPPDIKDSKIGDVRTDLESIRLIGRQLLGDRNGTRLSDMKAAPEPMINWLRGPSGSSTYEDFHNWDEVLIKSFGERKFIPLHLTAEMLYK